MSDTEYDIFNKMNQRLGSVWVCPLCKAGGRKQTVSNIVTTALQEHRNELLGMFDSFKQDVSASMNSEISKINNLEESIKTKNSVSEVKDIVNCVVADKLEADVREIVRQDQDQFNRRLNLAYGVPPQTDDAKFIHTFLKSEFKIDMGVISNIRCLPGGQNHSVPGPSVTAWPVLILFSYFPSVWANREQKSPEQKKALLPFTHILLEKTVRKEKNWLKSLK